MLEYSNMPRDANKLMFILRYIFNKVRTWYFFQLKYPWVKYKGFVRVMAHTRFAKRNVVVGHRVQFGKYCSIATDVNFGNNILIASRVGFIGKNDHKFDIPGKYIWDCDRGNDDVITVEDDVWIGYNTTIIAGVTIGKGAIVAAASLVTKNIPPCEVWGGVPAQKIRNRFSTEEEKELHIIFLNNAKY